MGLILARINLTPLRLGEGRTTKDIFPMNSITIQDVILHPVGLPLVEKLKTSYGAEPFKSAVIVELITTDGRTG